MALPYEEEDDEDLELYGESGHTEDMGLEGEDDEDIPLGGEPMTLEDGLLREEHGPQSLSPEDLGHGGVSGVGSPDPNEFAQMGDDELMSIVNQIQGGDESDAMSYMGGSDPMASNGSNEGVGTPFGQSEFISNKASSMNPTELARELLARRAAARFDASQNFQKKAEELNQENPFAQYMG